MPSSRAPSREPSYGSVPADADSAALLGALKAFGRPSPQNTQPGRSAPVAAAKLAPPSGRKVQKNDLSHVVGKAAPTRPGNSVPLNTLDGGKAPLTRRDAAALQPTLPRKEQENRGTSPSRHAALAAARRPTTVVRPATAVRRSADSASRPIIAPKPRRFSEMRQNRRSHRATTDSSSIAPTSSLVDLFERKVNNNVAEKLSEITLLPRNELPTGQRSPRSPRSPEGGVSPLFRLELENEGGIPESAVESASSSGSFASASEDLAGSSSPILVQKRDSRAPSYASLNLTRLTTTRVSRSRPPPSPLHMSRAETAGVQVPLRSVTSPPELFPVAPYQSNQSIAAQLATRYPRRITPLNTGDALADAIVASSLASARAPSPRKLELPPPSSRRHKQHKLPFSRDPSPAKHGMRHTLRKDESSDSAGDEDELHPYSKHKKKRLVRKHPNRHHEGDRKRWRDAVTERERKRYEGVWAANKGIHCGQTMMAARYKPSLGGESTRSDIGDTMSEHIFNIVARDIWSRSRLPDTVLEVIWALVCNEDRAWLTKDEFSVGLWLIDQRLKGRKLPVKVSDSVWGSVRNLHGLKIRRGK